MEPQKEILNGVLALVLVGSEANERKISKMLISLGARVEQRWTTFITHLIWTAGGNRWVRKKAQQSGALLVTPRWVEMCLMNNCHLPENHYRPMPRPSDLPSPKTLQKQLKNADEDNIFLSVGTSSLEQAGTSGVVSRVDTAQRRALPLSLSPPPIPEKKSQRKLYTQKDVVVIDSDDDSLILPSQSKSTALKLQENRPPKAEVPDITVIKSKKPRFVLTPMAAKLPKHRTVQLAKVVKSYRFVLTGMSLDERRQVVAACLALGGEIQTEVTNKTTHVLLGSFGNKHLDSRRPDDPTPGSSTMATNNNLSTPNALLGAIRGCRVLYSRWAIDSFKAQKWLHHHGYEVQHLKIISQKALVERRAYGLEGKEYGYTVFQYLPIRVSLTAKRKMLTIKLLSLGGALVCDHDGTVLNSARTEQHSGGVSQTLSHRDTFYVTLGTGRGEVSSRWVVHCMTKGCLKNYKPFVNI